MDRTDRGRPLPSEMQGKWVEEGSSFNLIVEGGEISLCGEIINYRYKNVAVDTDGVIAVELEFDEEIDPDDLDLTMLVYWPEGYINTFSVQTDVGRLVRAT
jgi:hypothetical protein